MILFIFTLSPSVVAAGVGGEIFSYGISGSFYNPSGLYVLEHPGTSITIHNGKYLEWIGGGTKWKGFRVGGSLSRYPKKEGTVTLEKDFELLHSGVFLKGFIEKEPGWEIGAGFIYQEYGGVLSLKRFINTKKYQPMIGMGYKLITEEGINLLFGVKYENTLRPGVSAGYRARRNIDILFNIELEGTGGGMVLSFPEDVFSLAFSYHFNGETQFFIGYTRIWKPERIKVVRIVEIREKYTEVPKKDVKEEIKEEKMEKPSPEIEERQRRLLIEGIKLYAKENYKKAIEKWQEVIRLYPSNELADKARKNIEDTKKILEKMNE